MSGMAQERDPSEGPQEARIRDFTQRLTEEERMLIILRRELYQNDAILGPQGQSLSDAQRRRAGWQAMRADLENRLEGKPYIFKLANRIRDDIARIEKLQAFEEEQKIDLAQYVNPPL